MSDGQETVFDFGSEGSVCKKVFDNFTISIGVSRAVSL